MDVSLIRAVNGTVVNQTSITGGSNKIMSTVNLNTQFEHLSPTNETCPTFEVCWQLTIGLIILLFFFTGFDDFKNFEEFRVRIWPNTLVNVLFIAFKGTINVISSDPPLIEWHIRFTTVPFKPFCLIKFEWDIHVFVFQFWFSVLVSL